MKHRGTSNPVCTYCHIFLSGVKDVQADHAASHLGKAIGVVTLLRSTPFHGNKGKVYMPNNVMIKVKNVFDSNVQGHGLKWETEYMCFMTCQAWGMGKLGRLLSPLFDKYPPTGILNHPASAKSSNSFVTTGDLKPQVAVTPDFT